MDNTRTVVQKWLANELDLHFLTKVIVLTNYRSIGTQTNKQTHSRKLFFRVQRVSKRGHLTKTGGGQILDTFHTFSDEDVKIYNDKNKT